LKKAVLIKVQPVLHRGGGVTCGGNPSERAGSCARRGSSGPGLCCRRPLAAVPAAWGAGRGEIREALCAGGRGSGAACRTGVGGGDSLKAWVGPC